MNDPAYLSHGGGELRQVYVLDYLFPARRRKLGWDYGKSELKNLDVKTLDNLKNNSHNKKVAN
ncbi:hypothetical protein SAMD00079811_40230 [Scytonema sp. HK-05]|nr:hypothetical protein NIES2130_00645 [Scytonema sp. HK-05]BAY46412.1 hypothetical protein SAMD00079811_40230 [Scytonema sp. HK-05]